MPEYVKVSKLNADQDYEGGAFWRLWDICRLRRC